jgi:hypothetical protein
MRWEGGKVGVLLEIAWGEVRVKIGKKKRRPITPSLNKIILRNQT